MPDDTGEPRYCADCKHILPSANPEHSAARVSTSVVTGYEVREYITCNASRILGPCGISGKYWEWRGHG